MSRLLQRTTRIVAVLAREPGRSVGLRTLAAIAQVPPATCTRILHQLVDLGWADQDGIRGRYRLGPQLYAMIAGSDYLGGFPPALIRGMSDLAHAYGAQVKIIALRGSRRQELYSVDPSGIERDFSEDDLLYVTASGRLLLALVPAPARRRLIGRIGLPTRWSWPGIATIGELMQELAGIRRARQVAFRLRENSVAAVALPRAGEVQPVLAAALADGTDPEALLAHLVGLVQETMTGRDGCEVLTTRQRAVR